MKFLTGNILNKTKGGKSKMKKTIGMITLIAVVILGLMAVVYATPTCDFDLAQTTAGTSDSYIRGTISNLSISITNTGWTPGQNVTGGVLSVAGGTITGSLNFNTTFGVNNTDINFTVDTRQLVDTTTLLGTQEFKNA